MIRPMPRNSDDSAFEVASERGIRKRPSQRDDAYISHKMETPMCFGGNVLCDDIIPAVFQSGPLD